MNDNDRTIPMPLIEEGLPKLVGFTPTVLGQKILLCRESMTFGSAPSAIFQLNDALVSRQHAEVRRLPDGHFTVTDLKSRNGTRINHKRLTPEQPMALRHGDCLFFAKLGFRFDDGSGLSTSKKMLWKGLLIVVLVLACVAAVRLWLLPSGAGR